MAVSASDLAETIVLLGSERADVATAAAHVVRVMSAEPETSSQLLQSQTSLIPELVKLALGADAISSTYSLEALINLAQTPEAAQEIIDSGFVPQALILLEQSLGKPIEKLLVQLLTNLTTSNEGVEEVLSTEEQKSGSWLILPARAVTPPQTEAMDPYEEVGSILTNLTREKTARLALLDQGCPFLSSLPVQLNSSSLARRQGFASTLRNIALKAESDGSLDRLLSAKEALLTAMDVLCGSGDEAKDPSEEVRCAISQTLLILANTEAGLAFLWKVGAPEKLRKGYESEENEDVCQAMEAIAEIILQGTEVE